MVQILHAIVASLASSLTHLEYALLALDSVKPVAVNFCAPAVLLETIWTLNLATVRLALPLVPAVKAALTALIAPKTTI